MEVTAYIYTRAPELHKFNYRMGIPVPSDRRAIVDQLSRGHDHAFSGIRFLRPDIDELE